MDHVGFGRLVLLVYVVGVVYVQCACPVSQSPSMDQLVDMEEPEQRIIRLWRPGIAGRIRKEEEAAQAAAAIQVQAQAKTLKSRQFGILEECIRPPSRDRAIFLRDTLLSRRRGARARVVRPKCGTDIGIIVEPLQVFVFHSLEGM